MRRMRRAAVTLTVLLSMLVLGAGSASASLCVQPHGETIHIVEIYPSDFFDRGKSLVGNPAGKMAAWEPHFNSDAIGFGDPGPDC